MALIDKGFVSLHFLALIYTWHRLTHDTPYQKLRDVPVARKLCGYISSLAACHQCYKIASCNNEEEERPNFGGFDDINEWFIQRDLEEL